MSAFEDREKAFEDKYKHDQDLQFRIASRRARLIGLWAAERLGITGEQADAYAQDVVSVDLDEPGHADIIRKLQADFTARKIEISDHRITRELERLWDVARQQVAPESSV
jgi:hypothetical protein